MDEQPPKLSGSNKALVQSWSAVADNKKTALDKIAADILGSSPSEAQTMGFITTCWAQVAMPHSDPTKWKNNPLRRDELYVRKNGDLEVVIAPVGGEGHPFGSMPRYLMAWVQTEVTKRKNQTDYCTIELGNNLVRFVQDKLKLQWGAGKRGNATHVKGQAFKLFSSMIAVRFRGFTADGTPFKRIKPLPITEDMIFFENWKEPNQDTLWQSTIKLHPTFARSLLQYGFPFDWRVVRAIGDSPLGIDLYWFLLRWWHGIEKKDGRSTHVTWRELKIWFGPGYADDRFGLSNFKKKAQEQLSNIITLTGGKISLGVGDHDKKDGVWIHRSRQALILPE